MVSSASVTTDTLAQYPHIPLFYVLSRDVTPEQEAKIHDVIRIAPVFFSIITQPSDAPLASRFTSTVLTVPDEDAALSLAQQLYDESAGHPNRSIIIGTANILTGVYPDRTANVPLG